jgi:hypothetical protein
MITDRRISGSFRDPSGFVFSRGGLIYRQINPCYEEEYQHFIHSGLYESLLNADLLVAHEEIPPDQPLGQPAYKIIRPATIPFISYPYEWCFSQLKDAALLTLAVQRKALECGMTLKDGSAFNVQYLQGKPVFIDTLSFEKYQPGQLWPAYRQFCQHFLAPLALMSYRDIRLSQLFRVYLDGIPLDLAGAILPWRSRLRFSLLAHLHWHARSQRFFSGRQIREPSGSMSLLAFRALIDSLETAVAKLHLRRQATEWADYYQHTNYSAQAMTAKAVFVREALLRVAPRTTWDFGANTGAFSRIAAEAGSQVMAFDLDSAAVEKHYFACKNENYGLILPLVMDLTNPSAPLGWHNTERMSLIQRGPADAGLALALLHHLAITHNIPLEKIAEFFSQTCRHLIIEFIPKEDSQFQRLLARRRDIFTRYDQFAFDEAFRRHFIVHRMIKIPESLRTLYWMQRKKSASSPASSTADSA